VNRVGEIGLAVPLTSLDVPDTYDVSPDTETVNGPLLSGILREMLHDVNDVNDALAWINRGTILREQIVQKDYEKAGYTHQTPWIRETQPGKLSVTEATNLLTFWSKTAEKIQMAEFSVPRVIAPLSRSALQDLIPILNYDGIDVRGIKVICTWITDGRVKTGEDVRALKQNPAITAAAHVMDLLSAADLDPVDTYLSLNTKKLASIGHLLSTSGMDTNALPAFIEDMKELNEQDVHNTCVQMHGRSGASMSATAKETERIINSDEDVQKPDESYIGLNVTVSLLPDGSYSMNVTEYQLRELWRKGLRPYWNGKLLTFNTNEA
jgi:hypothetical protein